MRYIYKPFRCAVCGKSTSFPAYVVFGDENDKSISRKNKLKYRSDGQMCPHCGYANFTISTRPPKGVDSAWLQSESYLTCDGMDIPSESVCEQYRLHLVRLIANDPEGAIEALDNAGSECRDLDQDVQYEQCYSKAADIAYNLFLTTNNWEHLYTWSHFVERLERYDEFLKKTDGLIAPPSQEFWGHYIESHRKGARIRLALQKDRSE